MVIRRGCCWVGVVEIAGSVITMVFWFVAKGFYLTLP